MTKNQTSELLSQELVDEVRSLSDRLNTMMQMAFMVPSEAHVEACRADRPASLHDALTEQIAFHLDMDVIQKFIATGDGWQARMNEALRKATP
jgi:uncharacterized protein (DUF4415 family)